MHNLEGMPFRIFQLQFVALKVYLAHLHDSMIGNKTTDSGINLSVQFPILIFHFNHME